MANLLDIFTKKSKGNMLSMSDKNPVKYDNPIARLSSSTSTTGAPSNTSLVATRDVNAASTAFATTTTRGSVPPKAL